MTFSSTQSAIVDAIKKQFPRLRQCEALAGKINPDFIKRNAVYSGSCYVGVYPVGYADKTGDVVRQRIKVAAFYIVKDASKLPAAKAALDWVETMHVWVPNNPFGLSIKSAENVKAENLYDATKLQAGISIWVVEWEHSCILSAPAEDDSPQIDTILASQAPDIGAEHEGDYEVVSSIQGGEE